MSFPFGRFVGNFYVPPGQEDTLREMQEDARRFYSGQSNSGSTRSSASSILERPLPRQYVEPQVQQRQEYVQPQVQQQQQHVQPQVQQQSQPTTAGVHQNRRQRREANLEQVARELRAQNEASEARDRERAERERLNHIVEEGDAAMLRALEAPSSEAPPSVTWEYVCHITNNFQISLTGDRPKVFASNGERAAIGNRGLVVKLVPPDFDREIGALRRVSSRNVHRILACSPIPENIHETIHPSHGSTFRRSCILYAEGTALIFEKSSFGSVDNMLRNDSQAQKLQWRQRLAIAADIAQGLIDIASSGLFHHDVKSANVIVVEVPNGNSEVESTNHTAQLIDLEFVKSNASTGTPSVTTIGTAGTPGYMCPLYAQGVLLGGYGEKQEVYGFGVFLLELYTGRVAADTSNRMLARDAALQSPDPRIEPPEKFRSSFVMRDLGRRATQESPDKRPSLQQCLDELKAAIPTVAVSFHVPREPSSLQQCTVCGVKTVLGVCCTGASRHFLCHFCIPKYADDQAERGHLMHEFSCSDLGTESCLGKFLPAEYIPFFTPALLHRFQDLEAQQRPAAPGNDEIIEAVEDALGLLRERQQELAAFQQREQTRDETNRRSAQQTQPRYSLRGIDDMALPDEVRRAFNALEYFTVPRCPTCGTAFTFDACVRIRATCCGRDFCAICEAALPCRHGDPNGIFLRNFQYEQLQREKVQRAYNEQVARLSSGENKRRFNRVARRIIRDFHIRAAQTS